MRVALVTRAFRARSPFDPLSHVRSLAPALARAGVSVEVFCGTRGSGLPPLSQRRTDVPDHASDASFGVTSIEVGRGPAGADEREARERTAAAFGAFLDRERPDVVHFEHLDAFGAVLVDEVEARGIASVLAASDAWPAQDRAGRTMPDLSPMELGDAEAEARAELAEAELGPVPEAGCFGDAARDARLHELLHEPLAEMADILRLRDARERVEARRAAKRGALSRIDRRFAATRALAKDLSAAVGRAFTFRAAGVDTSLFEPVEPEAVAPERGDPERGDPTSSDPTSSAGGGRAFAFIGTTAPIEGVDVLLDAFAEARASADAPPMSLTLHLEAGDPRRDAEVARRAEAVGASTRWTRRPADATSALAAADLLVVPARFGLVTSPLPRVAAALGRPVLLSRLPGLVEEVSRGAARTVAAPGDAAELAAEIARIAADAALAGDLARAAAEGAARVKSCDDEVREWLDTYRQIAAARRPFAGGVGLGHVEDVARSLEELRRLSVAELFERAQEGLGRLRKAFGSEDDTEAILRRIVARGGEARDRAVQVAALQDDLRASLDQLAEARASADSAEPGRIEAVGGLSATLERFEREAQERGEEAARAAAELRADGDEELERAERARRLTAAEALDGARQRFEALAREAARSRTALADAEAERASLAEALGGRDDLLAALRERVVSPAVGAATGLAALDLARRGVAPQPRDLDGIEAFCVAMEHDVRVLQTHDAWLSSVGADLTVALEQDRPDERVDYERLRARLDGLNADLGRRAADLASAREAGNSLRARVLAGPLAARVSGWERGPARRLEVPDDRRGELRPAAPPVDSTAPDQPTGEAAGSVEASDSEATAGPAEVAERTDAGPGVASREERGDAGAREEGAASGTRGGTAADEEMTRQEGAR